MALPLYLLKCLPAALRCLCLGHHNKVRAAHVVMLHFLGQLHQSAHACNAYHIQAPTVTCSRDTHSKPHSADEGMARSVCSASSFATNHAGN